MPPLVPVATILTLTIYRLALNRADDGSFFRLNIIVLAHKKHQQRSYQYLFCVFVGFTSHPHSMHEFTLHYHSFLTRVCYALAPNCILPFVLRTSSGFPCHRLSLLT